MQVHQPTQPRVCQRGVHLQVVPFGDFKEVRVLVFEPWWKGEISTCDQRWTAPHLEFIYIFVSVHIAVMSWFLCHCFCACLCYVIFLCHVHVISCHVSPPVSPLYSLLISGWHGVLLMDVGWFASTMTSERCISNCATSTRLDFTLGVEIICLLDGKTICVTWLHVCMLWWHVCVMLGHVMSCHVIPWFDHARACYKNIM